MNTNVMLTCANGQVGPSVLELIKGHPDFSYRVVGVASGDKRMGVGFSYCDAFYEVPMGCDDDYWNCIKTIVSTEDVGLIFVGSDEEALTLTEHTSELDEMGCKVMCSSHFVCREASDKLTMIKKLEQNGVPVGRYSGLRNVRELSQLAAQWGYPECDLVIKPRFGRGSKGLRIIHEDIDAYDTFFKGTKGYAKLDEIVHLFEKYPERIADYILMEYLPGDKYSSDMLVRHGETVCSVIRCNGSAPKVSPPTQLADIVYEEDVAKYSEDVARALGADCFIQVETGRDKNGDVKIIETNIRLDATLPITTGVNVNFYHELITYAMTGQFREMEKYPIASGPLRFIRYWQHAFIEV